VLDAAGLAEAIIFASGNLDEYRVRELVRAGAPIDSFGVGTALTTSSDAPYLDAVYKLQAYEGRPRRKRSTGKATWPGRKQVWRQRDGGGRLLRDVVGLAGEFDAAPPGEPLLVEAMRDGVPVLGETLIDARHRCAEELARLPPALATIDIDPAAPAYPVEISRGVRALADELDRAGADARLPA